MNDKSLLELAYEIISKSKGSVAFKTLWATLVNEKGFTEEEANKRISPFYTSLLLDGRFVTLGENKWDLRERHTFDKVHIDMKDVYNEVDVSDDDPDEAEEEKEYNEVFEDKVLDRKEEGEPEVDDNGETAPADPYNA